MRAYEYPEKSEAISKKNVERHLKRLLVNVFKHIDEETGEAVDTFPTHFFIPDNSSETLVFMFKEYSHIIKDSYLEQAMAAYQANGYDAYMDDPDKTIIYFDLNSCSEEEQKKLIDLSRKIVAEIICYHHAELKEIEYQGVEVLPLNTVEPLPNDEH